MEFEKSNRSLELLYGIVDFLIVSMEYAGGTIQTDDESSEYVKMIANQCMERFANLLLSLQKCCCCIDKRR